MKEKVRLVKVKEDTYQRLAKLGDLTDTFDSVIRRLLDYREGKIT